MIRFGSVCSGIEAASVAWESLGYSAAWLAEVDKFPSAVLAHRWPDVPNLGDMTQIPEWLRLGLLEAPDILVGGTPCQAFSVAGLRNGLSDERGQLTLKYVEILDEIDAKRDAENKCIAVWENVPGVLSSKDNAFGCFLGALVGEDCELFPSTDIPSEGKSNKFWKWDKRTYQHRPKWSNAGCVYGPKRVAAWRILDAQYFGVAQRRRRVFVITSARDGFDPESVLFESEGPRKDTPPSRETGERIAPSVTTGPPFSRTVYGIGEEVNVSAERFGPLLRGGQGGTRQAVAIWPAEVASTLNSHFGSKQGLEDQHALGGASLFVPAVLPINTQAVQGRPSDDGRLGSGIGKDGDPSPTLSAAHQHAVCTGVTLHGSDKTVSTATFTDLCNSLKAKTPGGIENSTTTAVLQDYQVRRLTPVECARLQGFPDHHTRIPWRNKQIEQCPDGPQYKAYGNSMAVPVMRWLGLRIKEQLGCL